MISHGVSAVCCLSISRFWMSSKDQKVLFYAENIQSYLVLCGSPFVNLRRGQNRQDLPLPLFAAMLGDFMWSAWSCLRESALSEEKQVGKSVLWRTEGQE